MTKDEYRQHMRTYSRDTMVMSFVVTKHPDYQALKAAGKEIIPWLLADLLDPTWHCSHCHGEGFEFPANWVWDNEKRNWPADTGIPCLQCKGKGSINSHACMMLLWGKAGDDAPTVENWMRGRHDKLTKTWQKWGEQRGYLPPTPDEEPSALRKIARALKLW
jgi:hypothetical protein